MTMNLYVLERTDDPDYDEYRGAVIRAASPEAAIEIVTEIGWSKRGAWRAVELAVDGVPGVIMSDFYNG
jgi:hypothetical protein